MMNDGRQCWLMTELAVLDCSVDHPHS